MKLKKPDIRIESAGIQSTTRFTIAATAQSFGVLSSTIYEDKIKAPIRELSTNAYDAHVEANCADRPFEVHLPNALDPEFRVRDYGISMSHEQIMTLYTTYFASNKRESNELNGCLGLGSKSPFAYTNQFWVTAYKDGQKRHYVATVDVDGPRFDQYPACETDEDDGFEVGFTVKEDDFSKFKDRAEEVYRYFKTQPTVTGVDFEHAKPKEHKIAGKFWRYTSSYSDSVAIMGNIGYPIEEEYLMEENQTYWERRENKYYQLISSGIHIDFEIGGLSMTASREGLEYTDEVVQAIKDKIDLIYEDIQRTINQEFADCKSLYEARVKAAKYDNIFRNLEEFVCPTWTNSVGIEVKVKTSLNLHTDCDVGSNDYQCHKFHYDGKPRTSRDCTTVQFGSKYKIFYNNMLTGGHAAVKYYLEGNPDDVVHLFQHTSQSTLKKLCKKFGMDFMVTTDELEKPPKTKRGSNGPRRVDVDAFELDTEGTQYNHSSVYNSRWWKPTAINLSEGQDNLYLELHRYDVCTHDDICETSVRTVGRLIILFEKLGISTPTVHGFVRGKAARVRKAKNWVHVYDWAKTKFQEYVDANDVSTIIKNDGILSTMDTAKGMIKVSEKATVPLLDGYFKKVSDALIKIKNRAEKGENNTAATVKDVAERLKFQLPNFSTDSWKHREERLLESYPVLGLCNLDSHYFDEADANLVVRCINDTEIAKVAKDLV